MGKFDAIETDKRIMEQKLKKHQLSPQEYQKFTKALPDESENSEEMVVFKEDNSEDHSG